MHHHYLNCSTYRFIESFSNKHQIRTDWYSKPKDLKFQLEEINQQIWVTNQGQLIDDYTL